jgi:long-chain acyl-CoA synthetase
VREFAVPTSIVIDDDANLADMVFDNANEAPDAVLFSRPEAGRWMDVTAAEFAAQVDGVARGLVASGVGVGDRVAIMSRTRYEWTLVDYAIWAAGAVGVPVYETSSAEQVRWILADSGARAIVLETAEHAKTLAKVQTDLPALEHVWQIDDDAVQILTDAGRAVDDAVALPRRLAARADDLATIIYTSGTTGRPKGCELTHRNLLHEVAADLEVMPQLFAPADSSTLMFLPLAHVLGRAVACALVSARVRVGHAPDVKNLAADLREFAPTFLLGHPRVFEKVYNTAKQRAHSGGKQRIFDFAERVAVRSSERAGSASLWLRLQHALCDKLVYGKLRDAVGGRCHSAISGGAPLSERLVHFFTGIGVRIYEGYGLTETTAACAVNMDGATKVGTVGRPLPGVSIRIADDGEICVKGPIVFNRYWHDEQATREALVDGWLHTGDLGELDDGFLRITGRKKEIIVTAGGKNVSPAVLEDNLRRHLLISQCVVVGDRRPFIAALITLDAETLPVWCAEHGKTPDVTALRNDPDLVEELQQAVNEANALVSRAESIRKFRVLATDFTEAKGEVTPSAKVRRSIVLERYADEVRAIYEPAVEVSSS